MHRTPSIVRVGTALYQGFLNDHSIFPHESKIRFLFTQKAPSKYNYLAYILPFLVCYYYQHSEKMEPSYPLMSIWSSSLFCLLPALE